MAQYNESPKALIAGEALEQYRQVRLSAAKTVVYCDEGEAPLGVTLEKVANGENVSVKMVNHSGTVEIEAAGAIAAAAVVYSKDDGKVDDAEGSGLPCGIAIKAASGAASVVEVLPLSAANAPVLATMLAADAPATGINRGGVVAQTIDTAQLEALLDTNTNDLFDLEAGDEILAVKLFVGTAAGAACAVTIGPDATLRTAGADVDGFLKAGDANAAGINSSDDPALTYQGDLLTSGSFVADAAGAVTITSSSDQSASAFVGQAVILYIPAGG